MFIYLYNIEKGIAKADLSPQTVFFDRTKGGSKTSISTTSSPNFQPKLSSQGFNHLKFFATLMNLGSGFSTEYLYI